MTSGFLDQSSELLLAIAHREAGRYKQAALITQGWLDRHPRDALAYALLAQLHSLANQDELAWNALRTALSIDAALPDVLRNQARLLLKQNKVDEALRAAVGAYQGEPANPENQLVLATVLGGSNRLSQAFVLVETVLRAQPGYAEAWAVQALLKLKTNDPAGALADAGRCVAIKPHLGQVWNIVGRLCHQLGNLPGALDALNKAAECEPNDAAILAMLGDLRRRSGSLETAIPLLERATRIAPGNAAAWVNLGAALLESKRIPAAKAAYAKAAEIAPAEADVYSNLSVLARAEGNLEEALHLTRRALELNPSYAEAHCNLANTLRELGRLDEAEAAYRRSLEIKPALAEAHCNLGITLRDLGQFDEAERSCRRATQINPDLAEAHTAHGTVLCDLGRLTEARSALQRALDIKPQDAAALQSLGNAFWYSDDLDRAAVEFHKAVEADPSNVGLRATVNLAILSYLDGKVDHCRARLSASRDINAKTAFSYANSRAYWRYLDSLVAWHQRLGDTERHAQASGVLHVIGDSHALAAQGVAVRYKGQEWRCKSELIVGCKQWHLGNDRPNQWKHKFAAVLARLPRESTVLLCFGEIDCRPNEGIFRVWKRRPGREISEIVESTVTGYINYVVTMARSRGHRLVVAGVPASNGSLGTLTPADAEQFVRLLRTFNKILMRTALDAGMDCLDIHALTDRGDGLSNDRWHIDENHLVPAAIAEAFDNHRRNRAD